MKREKIGELEELVMLTVGVLYKEAYGISVMKELEAQTGRSLNISAIHAVLKRLQEKGLLKSTMGGATSDRGGRRKRLFELTLPGKNALDEAKDVRNRMHQLIPKVSYNVSF